MRPQRHVAFLSLVAGTVAAFALLASAATSIAQSIDAPQRVAFQISTGSTTGSYFPVGQMLADLLSHPPGVGRCQAADVCGPAGLIVSTRASEGSIANVIAVNAGNVSSGIAQADVVALAVAGKGPFAKAGPSKQVRVIANLDGEDVHLLAAKNSTIKSVADLKGKRVSLSSEGSGTINTARAILAAYRLNEKSIGPNYDPSEKATELLQSGKLDAVFYVGGTPVNLIQQLLDEGVATLVPITGDGMTRLLRAQPHLYAHTIPQGAYAGAGEVATVAVDALWITDANQPDALIYGVVKSLFNPANRATLNNERVGAHFIELPYAAKGTIAPLHPGAARFYTEMGELDPQPQAPPPAPPAAKAPK
jgi:TRAP transporter TAXI family solute receptor